MNTQNEKSLKHKKDKIDRFNRKYENPRKTLFNYLNGKLSFSYIGKKCLNGTISSDFRSTLYKILLNILPYNEPDSWKSNLEQTRKQYNLKLNKLLNRNEYIIPFINCEEKKGTETYENLLKLIPQEDCDLLALIKLDVDRTFQELDLFKNLKIKEMLCKILYVFSKGIPEPSYCQGMNEILGTLLYAFLPSLTLNDLTDFTFSMDKIGEDNINLLYDYITNEEFFEADLYTVYQEVMGRDLTTLYTYNCERYRNKRFNFDYKTMSYEQVLNSEDTELGKRIKKIFYFDLKKIDSQFSNYLIENGLEPNIFLLRWLLCMLDRELNVNNTIWVWDCIFFYEFIEFTVKTVDIDKDRFNFLDHLCLSMMINLKKLIMESEDGGSMIMMHFLSFPNERNIREIITKATKISQTLENKNIWEDKNLQKNIVFNK